MLHSSGSNGSLARQPRASTSQLHARLRCIPNLSRRRQLEVRADASGATATQGQAAPHAGEGRKALIVGAGPAGCLAAMLLAKQGWQVEVFEKRPRPTGAQSKQRSWVLALYPRGIDAIAKAVPDAASAIPLLDQRRYKGLLIGDPREGRRILLQRPGAILDRTSLANSLLEELLQQAAQAGSGQGKGSVTVHFSHSLSSLDFSTRKAAFAAAAGASEEQEQGVVERSWDVLVGADGANSVVRDFTCKQHPDRMQLKVLTKPEAQYKTWYGLDPLPKVQAWDPDTQLPQPIGRKEGHFFYAVSSNLTKAAVAMCSDSDGTYCGYLTMSATALAALKTPADYEAVLKEAAPCLPEEWLPSMAQLLHDAPPSDLPIMRQLSSFAAPGGVVLIGDARATVTPALGQGVNSALEDAALLAERLGQAPRTASDVQAALEAYSAARQPQVAALQELEQMQTALLSGASFPACHTPQDYAQALARKFSIASYFGLHIMGSVLQALLTPDKSKAPFQQLPLPAIAAAGAGAAVSQPSGAASSQPAQPPSERSVVVIRAPPMSELLETSMPYTEMLAKVQAYGLAGLGSTALLLYAGSQGVGAAVRALTALAGQ